MATVEGRFTVLEQSQVWRRLGQLLFTVVPLMLATYFLNMFPPGVLGFHLLGVAFLFRHWQTRQNFGAVRCERDVKVTAEGVSVNGELAAPRADITDGQWQPRPARNPGRWGSHDSTVRLFDRRTRIAFEMEADERVARQVLGVLGLDAVHRRARFDTVSPLYATTPRSVAFVWSLMALCMFMTHFLGRFGAHHLAAPAFFLTLPLALGGMWPRRVEVGIDGVLVKWLWRKRFVPMEAIESVFPSSDRTLDLLLRGGEVISIQCGMSRSRSEQSRQKRDALEARILEAKAARAGGPKVDVAALVGRGTREKAEWVKAVTELRGERGYRSAVIRDEDLWAVVEDPGAPEDARAGAAIALRPVLDDEGRTRVRVAAEATVSPKLRVALDAAVGDDDIAAEEALAALANATGG